MQGILSLSLIIVTALAVSGCSWFAGEPEPSESRIEELKLPPDLTRDKAARAMTIPESGSTGVRAGSAGSTATDAAVLPQPDSVSVTRVGDDRWLTVSEPPEQVWRWVDDFLERRGMSTARREPALGIAETEWLYHERPVTGGPFAPVLPGPEDATVADRYLIRVEPGRDRQTAEVFVAHRRAVREDGGWRAGDSDPYLEAEFLRSMLVFFGYERGASHQAVATATASEPAASLERENGEPLLVMDGTFFDAWRRVGLALDRGGFTVEDRNRSEGVYYVRYDTSAESGAEPEEGGFLSSLAFWQDETMPDTVHTYRVTLDSAGGAIRVRVRATEDGPAPEPAMAEQMLGLLEEQLR